MSVRIFYPISSGDFTEGLKKNQRYRYFFGDKRRERKYHDLLEEMMQRQSIVVNQLSEDTTTVISYYRFMNNAHIELSELISRLCYIPSALVKGKKLLVALDTCAATLHSRLADKESASPAIGVVDDNRTPGFYLHPSLVFNEQDQPQRRPHIIGLGDMVLFNHPKQHYKSEENKRIRAERGKLPLEQKESFVWSLSAVNTHQQLIGADQITFLLDQDGDKYEPLARIRRDTGADFIVRSNVDRGAMRLGTKDKGKISELLSGQGWMDENSIALRGLNHYSKTGGIKVERKQRVACLKLRFISVKLDLPDRYPKYSPIMREGLTVIEVCELPTSVPPGEEPIHWRLLTTHQVVNTQQAWHIVHCYQQRWLIEQLFRVLKKQGLKIEQSQPLRRSDQRS